jgi:hypothetical protein
MSRYTTCIIYGFREMNEGSILNWDLVNKNHLDIFFESSEPFYAHGPYYGIKTEINQSTGYIRQGKVLKDTVNEFHKQVTDYCIKNQLIPPEPPCFVSVLQGDLHYNLTMYSIQELKYDGVKSVVYIEVGHANTTKKELTDFVSKLIHNTSNLNEKLKPDNLVIKLIDNDIEYTENFQKLFEMDQSVNKMEDDIDHINQALNETHLDDLSPTMLQFKLIFLHDTIKESWEFMRGIMLIKTSSEEHSNESLILNGSYVYFHNVGQRAQIGNMWLSEETIFEH